MAVQIPMRKVGIGVVVGAAVGIVVWSVKNFLHVEVPAEIALAFNTVLTFFAQYLVPNASEDPPSA